MVCPQGVNYDTGTRLQALALSEGGMDVKGVKAITNLSHGTIYRLRKLARDRGYNPEISKQLKLEYVVDRPKSGRPKKVWAEGEVRRKRNKKKKVVKTGNDATEVQQQKEGEGNAEVEGVQNQGAEMHGLHGVLDPTIVEGGSRAWEPGVMMDERERYWDPSKS